MKACNAKTVQYLQSFELLFTLLPCPTLLAQVTTYQGGRGEVLTANSQTIYFNRVTIYPVALAQNLSRGHHVLCKIYCLVLACTKAIFYLRALGF
jgi:hypothetical protein